MAKHMKDENIKCGIDFGNKESQTVPDIKFYGDYHFGQASWVCPRCGRIWSPCTLECYVCNSQKEVVTGTLTYDEIMKKLSEPSTRRLKND